MSDERVILEVIGLIYDAAGNPELWPIVVERLVEVLGAATGNIHLRSGPKTIAQFVVGMGPEFERSYVEYFGAINPYLCKASSLMRLGRAYRHEELYPDEEARKTEFWNEWIVPQKTRYALFGLVLQEGSVAGMVNVVRSRSLKQFDQDDIRLLEALMPHLQRAMQLHQRIARLESQSDAATNALNCWSMGVILLTQKGDVLLMNRAAEAILNHKDGLVFDRDGLRAARSLETAALRKLIHGAIHLGDGGQPGGAIALSRPSLKCPLNVLVTSSPNDGLFLHSGAAVAVFVSDPDASERPQAEMLRNLYGLTSAETQVAALLLQGRSLPTTADDLSITLNTAKTHAKRIYEKTYTRGQADLISSLLHGPVFLSRNLQHHPIG